MKSTRIVRPLSPVAPYLGGKRNLAKRLVERIEAVPHRCYAEAFVGMGGVFLRRRRAPQAEVINDLNRDVSTLFRVLQRHYQALMDMMRWQLTGRAEFERLAGTDPATLTDLERAARFLYLQRTAFGGKVAGRNFGVVTDRPARFDIARLAPLLEEVHQRLSGVVVECLPYGAFLERYDRPETLFYLDPPYWGSEGDYGRDLFGREDFERLAEQLRGLRGRFILSINDVPEIHALFAWAAIESVETTYTVAGGTGAQRAAELIVSGPGRRSRRRR
jgi:DNA adenine methylase